MILYSGNLCGSAWACTEVAPRSRLKQSAAIRALRIEATDVLDGAGVMKKKAGLTF
jgi:hypothetical protein